MVYPSLLTKDICNFTLYGNNTERFKGGKVVIHYYLV